VGTFGLLGEPLSVGSRASFRHLEKHFATGMPDPKIRPVLMSHTYRETQFAAGNEVQDKAPRQEGFIRDCRSSRGSNSRAVMQTNVAKLTF